MSAIHVRVSGDQDVAPYNDNHPYNNTGEFRIDDPLPGKPHGDLVLNTFDFNCNVRYYSQNRNVFIFYKQNGLFLPRHYGLKSTELETFLPIQGGTFLTKDGTECKKYQIGLFESPYNIAYIFKEEEAELYNVRQVTMLSMVFVKSGIHWYEAYVEDVSDLLRIYKPGVASNQPNIYNNTGKQPQL